MPALSIPGGKGAAGAVAAAGVDWEHAADHPVAASSRAGRRVLTPLEVSRFRAPRCRGSSLTRVSRSNERPLRYRDTVRGLVEVVLGFFGVAGIFAFYLFLLFAAGGIVMWLVRFVPLVGRRGRNGPRAPRPPTTRG